MYLCSQPAPLCFKKKVNNIFFLPSLSYSKPLRWQWRLSFHSTRAFKTLKCLTALVSAVRLRADSCDGVYCGFSRSQRRITDNVQVQLEACRWTGFILGPSLTHTYNLLWSSQVHEKPNAFNNTCHRIQYLQSRLVLCSQNVLNTQLP